MTQLNRIRLLSSMTETFNFRFINRAPALGRDKVKYTMSAAGAFIIYYELMNSMQGY